MAEKTNLGEKLQKLADASQRRIKVSQNRERIKECKKVERQAKRIAKNIIKGLPNQLKKAAREGKDYENIFSSECILESLFRAVVSSLSKYCRKNGLDCETKHYSPCGSDDLPSHDYFVIYLKKRESRY